MARRVKAAQDSDLILDLKWNGETVTFHGKRVTMAVEDELQDIAARIDEVSENPSSRPIDQITAQVEQLDAMLDRKGAPADDGKPQRPSEVIIPAYEAGDLTGPQIRKMISDVISATRPI